MSNAIKKFIYEVANRFPDVPGSSVTELEDQIRAGEYFWICNTAHAVGIEIPESLSDWRQTKII